MRYVLGTGSNSRLVIREPRYRTIDVPSSYQMATRRLLSRLPPRDDGIDDLLVVYSTSAASSTTTATTVPTGIYERADPGLELWCAVHSTAALYRTKEDRSWAVGTVGDVLKDEGILLSMREGDDVPTPIGIPFLVDDGTQDSDMIFAGGVGVRAATDAERDAMQWRALAEYSSTVHSARWVPASRWFSPLYRRTLGLFRSVGRQRDAGGSRDSHWQALAEAVGAHNVCRTLRAFLCTGAGASPGSSPGSSHGSSPWVVAWVRRDSVLPESILHCREKFCTAGINSVLSGTNSVLQESILYCWEKFCSAGINSVLSGRIL